MQNEPSSLRNFCFTLNNPTLSPDELVTKLSDDARVRYAIFQHERGATGTPHYQGYVELTKQLRFATAKNIINGNPHIEKRKNLFKSFKVFRRSRKYPMFQKYAAINLSTQNQPSGQWLDSGSTNNLDAPHTIIYAEGLEFNAGDTLFECMFEYKLQWQDRSSSTV